MKKGFTLVELLVVVVVIVTLMAVSFRIAGAGNNSGSLARTVAKMQKVENCLSGYYAAYGSYPPVPLHGSRDYTYEVSGCGIQMTVRGDSGHWSGKLEDNWKSVEAACRSQPVAFECPYPQVPYIIDGFRKLSDVAMRRGDPGFTINYTSLGFTDPNNEFFKEPDWARVQIFKLGLMSFLLPRILLVFDGSNASDNTLGKILDVQKQWSDNTDMIVNFDTGLPYESWKSAIRDMNEDGNYWQLQLQPSQAACARWIANLSKCVRCMGGTFYGTDIAEVVDAVHDHGARYSYDPQGSGSGVNLYYLRKYTVADAFNSGNSDIREFYYYSPAPYQTYVLWSAGKDGKTFPPWVPDEELKGMDDADRKTVQEWTSDDIVHMKN